MDKLSIKQWAEEDRPREKLLLKGVSVLSDSELLAILIRSGNDKQSAVELSQHILSKAGNDLNKLALASPSPFSGFILLVFGHFGRDEGIVKFDMAGEHVLVVTFTHHFTQFANHFPNWLVSLVSQLAAKLLGGE